MKDLPKVYANPIDHEINNIQKSYSSDGTRSKEVLKSFNVSKKIDEILNSNHHIYRSKVKLITKNGTKEILLVSRTDNELITINNEKIDLNDILDIEVV